jgi:hypothetical protein
MDETEFLQSSREAQQQRETTELEAARKLAEALRERAEEAEKREQEEKASSELRERLAREEKERQEREIETAQRLTRAETERAEEAEQHAKEQEESANKLRRRAFVAAGAASVALILGIIAAVMMVRSEKYRVLAEAGELRAGERALVAEEQARIAETRRLAAESTSVLTKYPQRGLLLAVEAVKVDGVRIAAAEQSLRNALALVGGRPLVVSQSGISESPSSAVCISPDNHWLVTGGDDHTVRLWDLTAKDPAANPVVLRGHKHQCLVCDDQSG